MKSIHTVLLILLLPILSIGQPDSKQEAWQQFGLPEEVAEKMAPEHILTFMEIRSSLKREIEPELYDFLQKDFYRAVGVPKDVILRMAPEHILTAIEIRTAGQFQMHASDTTALLAHNFYSWLNMPEEVVARMAPEHVLTAMEMAGGIPVRHEQEHTRIRSEDHHGFAPSHDSLTDGPSEYLILTILLGIIFMVVVLVSLSMFFNYQKSKNLHQLMYKAIEEGKEVPVELLRRESKVKDFRNGAILIILSLGMMTFSNFAAELEWQVGLIPFFIGLGFLINGKFLPRLA
ncbi:MAG: DUF6249 domain-containing protein [Bacteroidota bacterium]